MITRTSVLVYFDADMPTLVITDASAVAVAAYFSQLHKDSSENTVTFASRRLSAIKRSYSTCERKALSCI